MGHPESKQKTSDSIEPRTADLSELEAANPVDEEMGEEGLDALEDSTLEYPLLEDVFGVTSSTTSSDESDFSDFQELLESSSCDTLKAHPKGINIEDIVYNDLGRYTLLTRDKEAELVARMSTLAITYTAAIFSTQRMREYAIEYLLSSLKDKKTAQSIFDYEQTGVDAQGRSASDRLKLRISANVETLRRLHSAIEVMECSFSGNDSFPFHAEAKRDRESLEKSFINVILDCSLRPSALRGLERMICEGNFEHKESVRCASREYHDARNELITANMRLAAHFAGKRRGMIGIHTSDVLSPAFEGLIIGIDKFAPQHGTKVATYVSNWILQRISRYLLEDTRDISVPVTLRQKVIKISRESERILAATGSYPELSDVAKRLEFEDDIATLRDAKRGIYSGNQPTGIDSSENKGEFFDLLSDGEVSPPTAALQSDLQKRVLDAFEHLNEREKIILSLRFGIFASLPSPHFNALKDLIADENRDSFTLQEVGDYLNVSKERIRQLEVRALKKLQSYVALPDKELVALNWTKLNVGAPKRKRKEED